MKRCGEINIFRQHGGIVVDVNRKGTRCLHIAKHFIQPSTCVWYFLLRSSHKCKKCIIISDYRQKNRHEFTSSFFSVHQFPWLFYFKRIIHFGRGPKRNPSLFHYKIIWRLFCRPEIFSSDVSFDETQMKNIV